jgi:hydroxypyruvate reductase
MRYEGRRRGLGQPAQAGFDPHEHLRTNDAYPFFAALDDLLRPGPTGTNVNDLAFVFVMPSAEC